MSQTVEVTESDLELIKSLEFKAEEDKHCESVGHPALTLGHSNTAELWYTKFGCGCLFDGVFICCEGAIDYMHNLIVLNSHQCPFGWLLGNEHETEIIKIEPVK